MTKEEVIICLKGIKNYGRDTFNKQSDWQDCLDMAIQALEQEPCDDAVSRQEILNKINEVCFGEKWKGFRIDYGSNGQRDFLIDYIKQMSSVTLQEPYREIEDYENEIEGLQNRLDIAEYDKERLREEVTRLEEKIKALDQEPKTGHWIEHFDESGKWCECDQCHTDWGGSVNFCSNCGADMGGGKR